MRKDLIVQVVVTSFSMFFLPMFILGMVSPQVIRLSVPDVAHAGRVAGRVYAWSTAGAIVGTFAAGYVLLSAIGMYKTLLLVSLLLTGTSLLVARVWENNAMLYLFSIVLGGVTGGLILKVRTANEDYVVAVVETNYYTIKVESMIDDSGRQLRQLTLDHLVHSSVDLNDPGYLHYEHEHVQMDFLRGARATNPNPRVLVIGGGGYTFPRYAMLMLPETRMDVVEIDPGVTKVARQYLGLKDIDGLDIVHMDGRQFVAEKVEPGTYDLVIQDAVNDLSVPSHLMTKEYNDAVKRALKPDGVYLLTVIDALDEYGKLWKAAVHTLQETYPPENVTLLSSDPRPTHVRQVYVIYASDRPLDLTYLRSAARDQLHEAEVGTGAATTAAAGAAAVGPGTPHALAAAAAAPSVADRAIPFHTYEVPPAFLKPYLDAPPKIVLTDQFAPVDNLMADVFRFRYRKPPKEE
jgi:spermidine synthase